jgi:protein-S-isoprenylcysteine O-methyltransferase Ste14
MTDDNPGVIAPPPLIALVPLAVGLLLDWIAPVHVLDTVLTFPPRAVIGMVLVLAGAALALAAVHCFKLAATNVAPWQPAQHLAIGGVYAILRNPMYAGLMMVAGGIAIAFGSDWALVLLVPAAYVLRNFVVLREERYLEAKFGEPYRRYKEHVSRRGIW